MMFLLQLAGDRCLRRYRRGVSPSRPLVRHAGPAVQLTGQTERAGQAQPFRPPQGLGLVVAGASHRVVTCSWFMTSARAFQ
jgi:hypothetical protein